MPFADESIGAIYTSHTIEHVPTAAVQNFVAESLRVLRPGGYLRITCPDAKLLLRAVRQDNMGYWHWRTNWFQGPRSTRPSPSDVTLLDYLTREVATKRCRFAAGASQPLDVEELARRLKSDSDEEVLAWMVDGLDFDPASPGNHINWWTKPRLLSMLDEAGFSQAYSSGRGQSLFPPLSNLRHFDSTQPQNSLYVEAVR